VGCITKHVVSELRKSKPDVNVAVWYARHAGAEAYISVLVVGQIRQGIARIRRRDPARAEALERWLDRLVSAYGGRILPVTAEVAQEWGRCDDGRTPPVIDGLMAATAKVHRLTLVTRNVADVARTGVRLVNPFAPADGTPH
jgi:toxin FitB